MSLLEEARKETKVLEKESRAGEEGERREGRAGLSQGRRAPGVGGGWVTFAGGFRSTGPVVSGLLREVGEAREVLGFWRGLGYQGRAR